MTKKKFFKRRSEAEIGKLDVSLIGNPEGLVERIEEIDPNQDALILDFPLVHPAYSDSNDPQYNSRKTLRGVLRKGSGTRREYPSYIQLSQPRSVDEALKGTKLPFQIRNEDFFRELGRANEEDIFEVGYMRRPITGTDKSPILTPFWAIMNGTHMDSYTMRVCRNLPEIFLNAGSFVERVYGPNVIVNVPSQEKGKKSYKVKWANVPTIKGVKENQVKSWNTKPFYGFMNDEEFIESDEASPEHVMYQVSHERGTREHETFRFSMIDPRAVAGHQTMIRYFMARDKSGSYAPAILENSQVAIPSREDMKYWNKLNNNILIKEKTEAGNEVLKHPRIDQLSILMARKVGRDIGRTDEFGPVTMFWHPERDGRIRDYPVLPGEE